MKRNYGIDFLRILSMFMVVVLHTLGKGGILAAAEPNSLKYWVAWWLEIFCYCAVDCFALISGYVMWRSKPHLSKALRLWLQTLFYTSLALVLFFLFKRETVGLWTVVNAVFPITRNHYWYVSAYFGLLILSPLLNTVIANTEKRVLGSVLVAVWLLFCALPHALLSDPYTLKSGYSLMWLSLLYLAGGFISKYDIAAVVKKSWTWLVLGGMVVLTFLSKFVLENFPQHILATKNYGNIFISYASPSIVLIGVALLMLCSKLTISKGAAKLIGILAPATLGVYLIHVNQLVWDHIIAGFSARFVQYNCIIMVLMVLLAAAMVYAICTILELLRLKLFKLLQIDKLCTFIETQLTNAFHKHSKV